MLATANSGGYRYGASDQAFYIPAIRKAMDASLFPRDAWLLDAQGHVILWDGLVAGLASISQLPLPWVFLLLYTAGVLLLCTGAALVARAVGMSGWATVAFLAMLTLRHRIAKTGVNTLEGYLHPRMIAFAFGVIALAAFLKRRPAWAVAAAAAAGAVHPTTGVWFAMLLGVAAMVAWPRWRMPLLAAAVSGSAAVAWAIAAGPLAPRAVVMDATWLSAIATKDYLFPTEWPAYAWIFNMLPAAICAWALWRMRGLGAEVRGLLTGALVLTAVFLATLPFVAMKIALAVQMQIPRVFWLVELMALVVIALVVTRARVRVAAAAAAFFVVVSLARGLTVVIAEAEGRLLQVNLPANEWHDAMRWLRAQRTDAHVLADPGHAWRYDSSVRVAAERDVFHEDVKDAALAMYDRDVAVRVVERRALTNDFASKSVAELLTLAQAWDLDFVVTDQRLELPLAYENLRFRVYELRTSPGALRTSNPELRTR